MFNNILDVMNNKRGYYSDGIDTVYTEENSTALTGYFLAVFTNINKYVMSSLTNNSRFSMSAMLDTKLDTIIHTNVISVELPTYSITSSELQQGFGTKIITPLELANSNTTSISFYENQKGDVGRFFTTWMRLIMDETIGLPISVLDDSIDDENYKADLSLIVLPPFIGYNKNETRSYSPLFIKFFNIWPQTFPYTTYGASIESNEIILCNITFSYDRFRIYNPSYDNLESINDLFNLLENSISEDKTWMMYGLAESAFTALYELFGKYVF